MAVFDEPDMININNIPTVPNEVNSDFKDSEDSMVKILDAGSDVDIYKETELEKFNRMLFDAQKRVVGGKSKGEEAQNIQWKLVGTCISSKTASQRSCRLRSVICSRLHKMEGGEKKERRTYHIC